MIITLKGADFSANHIATLTTWSVFNTMGTGASYDGPSSVDRGAALSATVTLDTDYEVGSAGVSVTMGGTDISSTAVSQSGQTITITIAQVTGVVHINVYTRNTVTGESGDTTVLFSQEDHGNSPSAAEAVALHDSTMEQIRGKTITSVKVYAHSASSTFKLFKKANLTDQLEEKPADITVIQEASLTEGWNTIKLSTPVVLGSNEFLGMYDNAKTFGYSSTAGTGFYIWNTNGKWVKYEASTKFAPTIVIMGY